MEIEIVKKTVLLWVIMECCCFESKNILSYCTMGPTFDPGQTRFCFCELRLWIYGTAIILVNIDYLSVYFGFFFFFPSFSPVANLKLKFGDK